jgi:hypothetical protein
VLIWYEAKVYADVFSSLPAGGCTEEANRLAGGAAAAAEAALASGKIATLTDPKLVAALQGLPVEVAGATLRTRLTNVTFSLRDLLDQLDPVLSGRSISPRL